MQRPEVPTAFHDLAAAVSGRLDIHQLLLALCLQTMDLVDADTVGVSIDMRDEERLDYSTGSDSRALALEDGQRTTAEGPCHEVLHSREAMLIEDLVDDTRWPSYTPAALDMGCHAVACVPLVADGSSIGALSIYRDEPYEWPSAQIEEATTLASLVAGYAKSAKALDAAEDVIDDLRGALTTHAVLQQAKGVLAGTHDISVEDAFERLRRHARDNRLRIFTAAEQILDGSLKL